MLVLPLLWLPSLSRRAYKFDVTVVEGAGADRVCLIALVLPAAALAAKGLVPVVALAVFTLPPELVCCSEGIECERCVANERPDMVPAWYDSRYVLCAVATTLENCVG